MLMLVCRVRTVESRMRRYASASDNNASKAVAMQGLLYVGAGLLCNTTSIVAFIYVWVPVAPPFGVQLATSILYPLQGECETKLRSPSISLFSTGFMNMFVYWRTLADDKPRQNRTNASSGVGTFATANNAGSGMGTFATTTASHLQSSTTSDLRQSAVSDHHDDTMVEHEESSEEDVQQPTEEEIQERRLSKALRKSVSVILPNIPIEGLEDLSEEIEDEDRREAELENHVGRRRSSMFGFRGNRRGSLFGRRNTVQVLQPPQELINSGDFDEEEEGKAEVSEEQPAVEAEGTDQVAAEDTAHDN